MMWDSTFDIFEKAIMLLTKHSNDMENKHT
jgi:hypothetical protein